MINFDKSNTVEIFLPCFNSSELLQECLDSIVAQSYENIKVILVDNNSTDNSVEVFNKYNDPRFHCLQHKTKVSLAENFNRCLKYAKEDFFCIMHADDIYHENYIRDMLFFMKENPNISIGFCDSDIIDSSSNKKSDLKNLIKRKASKNCHLYLGCKGVKWLSNYNKIIAPTAMYKSSLVNQIGVFNPNLSFVLDWEYWFRTLKKGYTIGHLGRVLFRYRIHEKSQTSIQVKSLKKYEEIYDLILSIQSYLRNSCGEKKCLPSIYLLAAILNDSLADFFRGDIPNTSKKLKLFFKYLAK